MLTIKDAVHPADYAKYNTEQLRHRFVIDELFRSGEIRWTYCGEERLLLAGASPTTGSLLMEVPEELGPEVLLERRELGIVNLGADGEVAVGGTRYKLSQHDGLYVGQGAGEVTLHGEGAKFYCAAAPAHKSLPTREISLKQAKPMKLGARETSNERTIFLYIAPGVVESCQLMMGITKLQPGSVWNTMPCHRHLRRMEVYLYCDLPEDEMVVHLMGRPEETRNLIIRNEQAVISPSWSIHTGVGTHAYSFLWCMIGENQDFADMATVPTSSIT